MNRKYKRLIFLSVIVVVVIVVAFLGKRYFPFSWILKAPAGPDSEFVNQQLVTGQAPNSLLFDFEIDPKSPTPGGLYKGIAHSGQYSAKAFGNNAYSIAIERTVAQTGVENLKAVSASTWVYIFPGGKEPDAVFVFTVTNSLGINVSWQGVSVKGPDIPVGKWFKVSGMFDVSNVKIQPDSKLQVYMWNRSRTDILVDDFYIVFGSPKERRGDTTFIDMTKGLPFQPRFNFPPYQVSYLLNEEINNRNSAYLVMKGDVKEGFIGPTDKVITDRFTGNGNSDDILVIKQSGKPELYSFCTEDAAFRKVPMEISAQDAAYFSNAQVLKGSFTAPGSAQVLLISEKGILLGGFEKGGNPCTSGGNPGCRFKNIALTPLSFIAPGGLKGIILTSADLNGDRIAELLVIGNGSWKIFRFAGSQKTQWIVVASGEKDVDEWASVAAAGSVTAGRFLPKYAQDVILTVFKDPSKPVFRYAMLRYDNRAGKFVECFSDKQGHTGLTIGLDSLKPGDEFFFARKENSNDPIILHYNRDWRFDLKQIKFNDTTFEVLRTIDFQGYEKDHNPKYFESLRIIPYSFLKAGSDAFLIIGKNKKETPVLPDAIQVYSFRKQ